MAGKRKNFFMVDNRIFEYGLKPRDIAVSPSIVFFVVV